MSALLAIEVVAAILLGIVYLETFKTILEDGLAKKIPDYTKDTNTKDTLDGMQKSLECCGARGPSDWNVTMTHYDVPDSCCKPIKGNSTGCGNNALTLLTNNSNIYEDGCVDQIFERAKEQVVIISVTLAVIAIIELAVIVLASRLTALARKRGDGDDDEELSGGEEQEEEEEGEE